MSEQEFQRAFPSESDVVEFKTGVSGEQIQDSAVAFSNARGGVILVGVRDDGEVAGRVLDAGTEDDIHQALQAAVTSVVTASVRSMSKAVASA
jgi:predicted HTH transcriptional regulator